MAEDSGIQWTDHTFNPWWGCAKVSPGCKNCYAETLAVKRRKLPIWGLHPHAERKPMSEGYWHGPVRWNRKAEKEGRRYRVFCASMADVFDEHSDVVEHRARLFELIEATPRLDWQLLTKRPANVMGMVPESWQRRFPANVWMGTSVEDQERADQRIPALLEIPAHLHFLSCEPLLGPVDLRVVDWPHRWPVDVLRGGAWELPDRVGERGFVNHSGFPATIDWVIVGGESGPGARRCEVRWIRDLVTQCGAAGVAAFVKQLGSRPIGAQGMPVALRDKKGGEVEEWPQSLRIRQFPGDSR